MEITCCFLLMFNINIYFVSIVSKLKKDDIWSEITDQVSLVVLFSCSEQKRCNSKSSPP